MLYLLINICKHLNLLVFVSIPQNLFLTNILPVFPATIATYLISPSGNILGSYGNKQRFSESFK